MPLDLSSADAKIFRITHIDNIPWLLRNGLHCPNSEIRDPNFVGIGNPELIEKRAAREVPQPPHGYLSDYVPFYFTPKSPMHFNISTGYRGVAKRPNSEIVILVASARILLADGPLLVFTDRHAYLKTAKFFASVEDLSEIDWQLLCRGDFRRDPDDPDKVARYEAEALIHRTLPIEKLLGIACHDENMMRTLKRFVRDANVTTRVATRPAWYF